MKFWKYTFNLLLLLLIGIVIALFQLPDGNLHVIACDVGQGDAILIVYKNFQILTDGGPDNSVLTCLSSHMPFWDREVEFVILTHPQKDHFMGLVEVFKRYKVNNYLYNRLDVSTPEYELLKNAVGGSGVRVINPGAGMVIRLGLMQLEILAPLEKNSNDKLQITNEDSNTYSIVYLLNYGQFRGIFTGDMDPETSDVLAANWNRGPVNYIKIPHHGSKNGLTENLLNVLVPKIGVISVGKENSYGHPHEEVLQMLDKYKVRVIRTDQAGDVEFVTDGVKIWEEK